MYLSLRIDVIHTSPIDPITFVSQDRHDYGERRLIQALEPYWSNLDIVHQPLLLNCDDPQHRSQFCEPDFLVIAKNTREGSIVEVTRLLRDPETNRFPCNTNKNRQEGIMARIRQRGGLTLPQMDDARIKEILIIDGISHKSFETIRQEVLGGCLDSLTT